MHVALDGVRRTPHQPAPGRIGWCERHPDGSIKPNFAME